MEESILPEKATEVLNKVEEKMEQSGLKEKLLELGKKLADKLSYQLKGSKTKDEQMKNLRMVDEVNKPEWGEGTKQPTDLPKASNVRFQNDLPKKTSDFNLPKGGFGK